MEHHVYHRIFQYECIAIFPALPKWLLQTPVIPLRMQEEKISPIFIACRLLL